MNYVKKGLVASTRPANVGAEAYIACNTYCCGHTTAAMGENYCEETID